MSTSYIRRHRADLAVLAFSVLLCFALFLAWIGNGVATTISAFAMVAYIAKYDLISGRSRSTHYFLLYVWQDVEPQITGPFHDENVRDTQARVLRRKEGPDEGGIYWVDVDVSGNISVGAYTGGFLDDVDEDTSEAEITRFENHYRCPQCSKEWSDVWSATCDDTCPYCGARNISPYDSEELNGALTENH